MGFYRFQLKLWVLGLVGLSWVCMGMPAIAQSAIEELNKRESETVVSHRNGYDCFDLATEQLEPLGEFRQAVMETATITARAADTIEEQSGLLIELSESYGCLAQVEIANTIAQEALSLIEDITDTALRGRLLTKLANIYGKTFGDTAQMNVLLADAIALSETIDEDYDRISLIGKIISTYLYAGEYQKARDFVDRIEEADLHFWVIQSYLLEVSFRVSEEEWAEIIEIFPELVSPQYSIASQAEILEDQPLLSWQIQLAGIAATLQQTEDLETINALIAEQRLLIEDLPELGMQSQAYLYLSFFLSNNDNKEQALSLLETALERESISEIEAAGYDDFFEGFTPVAGQFSLAFAFAGDYERSIMFLQQLDEIDQLLLIEYLAFEETDSYMPLLNEAFRAQLISVVQRLEQTARERSSPQEQLLDIAFTYTQLQDEENARRLANEILTNYRQEDIGDDDFLIDLAILLFSAESYDSGLALLDQIEDTALFSHIPSGLIYQDRLDLAWIVFEKIASPFEQLYALTEIAITAQDLVQLELSFEIAIRALDIAQADSFDREDYFTYSYGDYGQDSIASLNDEQYHRAVQDYYESLFLDVIYWQESPENQRRIIEAIEDETIQRTMYAEFFPEEVNASEIFTEEEIVQDDGYWNRTAREAAREERFVDAIDAIAQIESPAQQSRTLLTIATCHAYSATPLETATGETLTQIQQRSTSQQ